MGCRHDYTKNGITSALLGFRFGCAWIWLAENFLQMRRWFFFFISWLVFLAKQCLPLPTNNIIVAFWSLRGIFKRWQQALRFVQSEKLVVLLVNVRTHFSFLHVGQYTSPIVSRTLLSTHNSFFSYLVDWNATSGNNCWLATKFIFF